MTNIGEIIHCDIPSVVDNEQYIRKNISDEDLYNQLAEEASELAQAANKMIRVLRGTNPTPKSFDEVSSDISEELSDLLLVAQLLGLETNRLNIAYKTYRWRKRLEEKENDIHD